MSDTTQPLCMTCRRIPGARRVPSSNGRVMMWKCKSCIDHTSISFLHPKDTGKEKIWGRDK